MTYLMIGIYLFGLVGYPIVYGYANPPVEASSGRDTTNIQQPDLFSITMQAIFWPVVMAFTILGESLRLIIFGLVTLGQRLRGDSE
jgi:hypothetical protein